MLYHTFPILLMVIESYGCTLCRSCPQNCGYATVNYVLVATKTLKINTLLYHSRFTRLSIVLLERLHKHSHLCARLSKIISRTYTEPINKAQHKPQCSSTIVTTRSSLTSRLLPSNPPLKFVKDLSIPKKHNNNMSEKINESRYWNAVTNPLPYCADRFPLAPFHPNLNGTLNLARLN
jgi:hypothetical protein